MQETNIEKQKGTASAKLIFTSDKQKKIRSYEIELGHFLLKNKLDNREEKRRRHSKLLHELFYTSIFFLHELTSVAQK